MPQDLQTVYILDKIHTVSSASSEYQIQSPDSPPTTIISAGTVLKLQAQV